MATPLTLTFSHHAYLADVADKHFGFMDTDVGVTDERREIVHHIATRDALIAPVPGHPDVMDLLAVDHVWPHALGHQRFGLNRPTRCADAHRLGIAYTQLLGVLRADLYEQFR